MKCVICKQGSTKPGHATVTLQRGNTTVIFKEVPADICENCGEYFITNFEFKKFLNIITPKIN